MGIERNLLAKKFIQKILYSKQSIKIALFYAENPQDFQKLSSQNNTASLVRGGAKKSKLSKEKSVFPLNNEFVACNVAAKTKSNQTFNLILPNLIHQSKKRNLHR